ncbi:MAG: FHA domain-containing protein [Phycisphaerae bacterium]|nr:FHA domain-containing protein [Phycisphaerae bacterium]
MGDGDKIRIDWDDINRPEIAEKVERDRRFRQAAAHYEQATQAGTGAGSGTEHRVYGTVAGVSPTAASRGGMTRLMYHPAFSAGLAALVAAFLAWAVTEPIPYFQQRLDIEAELSQYLESKGYTLLSLMQESAATQEWVLEEFKTKTRINIYVETMIWFGLIGAAVGAALSSVEYVVGRAYSAAKSAGLIGLGVGFIGGALAGGVAQFLYSSLTSLNDEGSQTIQILARSAGWGLAGMVLGAGQGIAMRSGKKVRNGLIGGLLGGLIGGALFDPIANSLQSGWASRMLALCVIGAATGVLIGIVESVLKDAWLLVTGGPLTGKQFVIYKNPTVFGSAPKADIYLFKDASVEPRHAALHTQTRGYEIEDLGTPAGTMVNGQRIGRHRLKSGDSIQIGQYAFSYTEKSRAKPGTAGGH